jgi:hypothetical protein
MKYFAVTAALVAVRPTAATDTSGENATCFLLKDHAANTGQYDFTYKEQSKPFPSLTQCYKSNQGACCVSAHDAYIESMYAQILSSTCLRQFSSLEQYYCLGCNPEQGKWVVGNDYTYETDENGNPITVVDPDTGVDTGVPKWNFDMRICKSFMNFLYNPDEENNNYDKCGLLNEQGIGYLPTARYFNASQFITTIKPPYFEHVNWIEIDDENDHNNNPFDSSVQCVVPEADQDPSDINDTYACCFSNAERTHVSSLVAAASTLALMAAAWRH